MIVLSSELMIFAVTLGRITGKHSEMLATALLLTNYRNHLIAHGSHLGFWFGALAWYPDDSRWVSKRLLKCITSGTGICSTLPNQALTQPQPTQTKPNQNLISFPSTKLLRSKLRNTVIISPSLPADLIHYDIMLVQATKPEMHIESVCLTI